MKLLQYFLIILIVPVQILHAQQKENVLPFTDEMRDNFIQRATQLRKEEKYNNAAAQLDSILLYRKVDAPVLLFKGDLLLEAKRYAAAADTYKQLLPLNFETTNVTINLSYALFMNHQPSQALNFAAKAWEGNKLNSNAIINYFNALLWNVKTHEAAVFFREQNSLLTPAQQLVLQARLYMTEGNYTKSMLYYDSLVKTFPDKHYVLEYAEILLGKKEIHSSDQLMQQSKNMFTVNEYMDYKQKLRLAQQQNTGAELVYFKDVAKNIRIENSIWWQQRAGTTYRFRLSAGTCTITSAQNEKIRTQFANVSINERWNKAWTGETTLHLQLIQPHNSQNFSAITAKQIVQYQPNDRRMIGLYYQTEILSFTAELLKKNIRSHSAGYVTHLMLGGKTGFYSQGSAAILNDNNQRFQFFGSFYRLFRTEPTVKAGINFSALHFKDNSIKNYFSPHRYFNTEVFADYSTALPHLSRFYLQLQVASGMQKIEQQQWEPALRFQTELGFRLSHFETSLKYQTSNVASNTGTGYKFNWFTARIMWKW
ncbi:MAG: BCSC C-terminal domain-containing protein [Chitinophagaceae bacterium]|nr:BCSC C-terminal domain-containing protein [Chitinophagaceae bacterium]